MANTFHDNRFHNNFHNHFHHRHGGFGNFAYAYPFNDYPNYGYGYGAYGNYPMQYSNVPMDYSDYSNYSDYSGGSYYGYSDIGTVSVRDLQDELARRGYYKGTVDGVMGPLTRQAITDFQQDNNLRTTGRVTPALLSRLGM